MHIFLLTDFYRDADLRSLNEVKRGQHKNRPMHEVSVHVACAQTPPINAHPGVSGGARGLHFGQSFHCSNWCSTMR